MPRPFSCQFFLLPVGLADFIGKDAKAETGVRQRYFTNLRQRAGQKKPRLLRGAASRQGGGHHQALKPCAPDINRLAQKG